MSKPLRKSDEMSQHNLRPETANDNKPEFRKDTSVEMHPADIKTLKAFKDRFLLGKETIPNLRILMVNTGVDVSVQAVFPKSKIMYIEEDRGDAERLQRLHLHAIKANYEVRREFPDPDTEEKVRGGFDIVVVLEPKAEPTPKFMQNIKGDGWVLCRARMAGALRATGYYEVMGAIDKEGGVGPTLAKGPHGEMWGEVTNDAEFQAAEKTDGMATYDDALGALKAAGKNEKEVRAIELQGTVLFEYRKLLRGIPEKKASPDVDADQGESTGEPSGKFKAIPWKIEDKKIYAVKKSSVFNH